MLGKLWMEVRAELRERAHGIGTDRGGGGGGGGKKKEKKKNL